MVLNGNKCKKLWLTIESDFNGSRPGAIRSARIERKLVQLGRSQRFGLSSNFLALIHWANCHGRTEELIRAVQRMPHNRAGQSWRQFSHQPRTNPLQPKPGTGQLLAWLRTISPRRVRKPGE